MSGSECLNHSVLDFKVKVITFELTEKSVTNYTSKSLMS